MKLFNRYKNKKGYTLAEALLAVMILVILMAIAIPAIFSIQKNLRQKSLDDKAELIYTAVQNNLTKLKNNGNSETYAGEKAAGEVDVRPSDSETAQLLYYDTAANKENTGSAASVLVTADTIDGELYNHYWVVEYNPYSASVYAVFYSESRDDYNTVVYNGLRTKESRLEDGARVGYYGGTVISGGSTATLAPKLTITNEEKLVASISCKRPDENPLSFEVTLEDDENHKLTLKYKQNVSKTGFVHEADDLHIGTTSGLDGNESGTIEGAQYNLTLTLDDLGEEGKRFASLYGKKNGNLSAGSQLTAGSGLIITVKVKSESSVIDGLSTAMKTNSLFADSSTADTAVVRWGRHLQNLDQASEVNDTIKNAIQESNIHFEELEELGGEKGDTSSWFSCYEDRVFTPITNTNLTHYTGSGEDENGGTLQSVIYHLNTEKSQRAGLFAVLPDGMTVDSVRLSGAMISGNQSADSCIGGIAGETAGKAELKNCQVYLEREDVEGKNDSQLWILDGAVQGGLVGRAAGEITITDSFAATVIGGETSAYAGGLLGCAEGKTRIFASYGASYLTGTITGGLIGSAKGETEAEACYAVGYENAKTAAGGFFGESTEAAKIRNSYTAVNWLHREGEEEGAVKRYASAPKGTADNVYYLKEGNTEGEELGEKVTYKELSDRITMTSKLGSEEFVSAAFRSEPYNLRKQGLNAYSYPSLKKLAHYGDWEATFESGSLVYYEVYENTEGAEEIGFFGGNLPSSLKEDGILRGDGYGIVYSENEKPEKEFSVVYQTKADTEEVLKIDPDTWASVYKVTVEEEPYVVYALPSELVNAQAISETYYQKLTIESISAVGGGQEGNEENNITTISGSVFYYNPHFAKTAVSSTEGAKAPDVPAEINVRTPRQLYQLSLYYPDYANAVSKSTFSQERDLYYGDYSWTDYAGENSSITVQQPIGAKEKALIPFVSGYNGKNHRISGISFSSKGTAVGLIGENRGSLQNVFLVWNHSETQENPYLRYEGKIANNRVVYMGMLTGVNRGRIQNCAACGYDLDGSNKLYIERNGTLYFGGIAGSNRGVIASCQADVPQMNANILYGNAFIGGFAGENSSAGTIRSSYAIGTLMIEYAKGANAVLGGFTAKNDGVLRDAYCAVALTAAGSTSTYGFAPKGRGSISGDCYYLNGGTYEYAGQMYAYDNKKGSGTGLTYHEIVGKNSSRADGSHSYCHGNTEDKNNTGYPFAAVVRDGENVPVHFGNWQSPVSLGSMGILYWELEEGGANSGYHFSYIGYTAEESYSEAALRRVSGSTLCQQHDDGGKITAYGYGYYYADIEQNQENGMFPEVVGENVPDEQTMYFQHGAVNQEASQVLMQHLKGFRVVAYTSAPSVENVDNSSYMRMYKAADGQGMDRRTANGVWIFTYMKQTYRFELNPFFANSMQYGSGENLQAVSESLVVLENGTAVQSTEEAAPGTAGCTYEIRSADQLEYLNWNYQTGNARTTVESADSAVLRSYPYLGYMQGNGNGENMGSAKYVWQQTHDVDADMMPMTSDTFIQIGSMYDANASNNSEAQVSVSYFNGSFDGNSYSIKNIEINSSSSAVGLFGSIIGAKVKNVILYSENGNYIQRNQGDRASWYTMGGLCGLAALGSGNSASDTTISNCTVSGYVIQDNSTACSFGGGNVGGMFGMSTMDLENCTSVNKIVLNIASTYGNGRNLRIGGLVGGLRGTVTNCYTGGEITCTESCKKDNLFIGGINGGIYIKNTGNLMTLLGKAIKGFNDDVTGNGSLAYVRCSNGYDCQKPTVVIRNCYTYMRLPSDPNVRCILPMGSNGETEVEDNNSHHTRILIENSYYYENHVTQIGSRYNLTDHSQPLTWKQLAGEEKIGEGENGKYLLELLNEGSQDASKAFSPVTTIENNNSVTDKYSFPGNRLDLDGENYPFPTILRQQATNDLVSVHYGEWPLEGIVWKESRGSMDIFEDMKLEEGTGQGTAEKVFYLMDEEGIIGTQKQFEDFTFAYSNGEDEETQQLALAEATETAAFTDGGAEEGTPSAGAGSRILDPSQYIAEVVGMSYSAENGCYEAVVRAKKTGTTIITANVEAADSQGNKQTYTASFSVTVTADLSVYASPAKITQQVGETTTVQLHAVPGALLEDVQLAVFQGAEENQTEAVAFYSEETEAAPIAAYAEAPEKDLASLMKWEIEESISGPATVSPVTDSSFTVKSESVTPVTLTIFGTCTYEGEEYTATAWVEVEATAENGIFFRESEVTLELPESETEEAQAEDLYLEVSGDCLNPEAPESVSFSIRYADESETAAIAQVQEITWDFGENCYKIKVMPWNVGRTVIILSAVGKDEKLYEASVSVAVTRNGSGQENIAVEPSAEAAGFAADILEGWDGAEVPSDPDGYENAGDAAAEGFVDEMEGWEGVEIYE